MDSKTQKRLGASLRDIDADYWAALDEIIDDTIEVKKEELADSKEDDDKNRGIIEGLRSFRKETERLKKLEPNNF